LRVERRLDHEHRRLILLQDAGEVLSNLGLHVSIRKCLDAVPNEFLAFQNRYTQVLQTRVHSENATWGQCRHISALKDLQGLSAVSSLALSDGSLAPALGTGGVLLCDGG